MTDDLEREWMPDEETKRLADLPPQPVPGSEDLPDEVRDGDIGEGET